MQGHFEPGDLIGGRYRVDAKLGEGGMGAVYRVFDTVDARALALKCLMPAAAAQPAIVGLFEREFYALKSLAHPHIVMAHDYGVAESPYYTLELLTGATVNSLAPMPWRQVCSLLRDVASALALIHSRRLVHRDVTSRNIQQAEDGTIKLIDFGSLTAMGVVAKDYVGTPAFMAPEAVHRLILDQRTDLYSLGATAYHLLTARHAFPARLISGLRDVWRTRPALPSKIVPGVPAQLDQLVMSLLELNPVARPVNAGILIAQLNAIGNLSPQASDAAAQSFLTTPRLVGRSLEIYEFQQRLARAHRAQGSCLLVEAEPGMGRSRILDAFALEAQISGALVVRTDEKDGATAAATLAALQAGLREIAPDESAPDQDQETQTFETLRQVVRKRAVVILVDDAHRYTTEALALLARVLRKAERHRLLLIISHSLPLAGDLVEAIQLIGSHSDRMQLHALDMAGTNNLLASCFDNAPNLKATAAWCHTVSAGRPGICVALAQHLVDEGIAVYQGGAWALPESFEGLSLPETAEQLIRERLLRLDADQLLWGQMLSLIPAAISVTTAKCVRLMQPYTSVARSHAAIEGLMAAQLVLYEGEFTRIHHANVSAAFVATLSPPLACSLHRLLGAFFESEGNWNSLSAAAYHLQQAGDHASAVRVINFSFRKTLADMTEQELARLTGVFGQWGDTFERALDFAEREGWPRSELYPLYMAVLSAAVTSEPHWLSRAEPLFEYLKQDTGFVYWSETELDALESGAKISAWKLVWRLLRATVRHWLAPRRSRGLPPIAALTALGYYVTSALGVVNITQTFHKSGPPLARALLPFRSLSPAIDLLYDLLTGAIDAGRGVEAGWRRLQSVMQRLQQRVKGLPDGSRVTSQCILRHLDALECLAPIGDPRTLEVAEWLENAGAFDAHAWQLRMIYHLYAGDAVNAELCREKVETFAVATRRDNLSAIAGSKDVAQAHALSGDAASLRATLDSLETTADRFPHWRGQLLVYRGEYARLVGDLPQAKEALEQALAFAPPGENYSWAKAAAPYIDVLVRLGQVKEAISFVERALADSERVNVSPIYRRQIDIAAAMAWAADGQLERAAARLDELLRAAAEQGVRGVTVAVLEEARARVALLAGDSDAFENARRGMSRVFANHDHSALVTRYRSLINDAHQHHLGLGGTSRPPERSSMQTQLSQIHERIDHAVSDVRLRRALELLIEHCEADQGHLFVLRDAHLACAASVGAIVTSIDLDTFVRSVQTIDAQLSVGVTATHLGLDADVTQWGRWTSDTGAIYDPIPLHALNDDGEAEAVGIAILHASGAVLRPPKPAFLRALVRALTETGDLPNLLSVPA